MSDGSNSQVMEVPLGISVLSNRPERLSIVVFEGELAAIVFSSQHLNDSCLQYSECDRVWIATGTYDRCLFCKKDTNLQRVLVYAQRLKWRYAVDQYRSLMVAANRNRSSTQWSHETKADDFESVYY